METSPRAILFLLPVPAVNSIPYSDPKHFAERNGKLSTQFSPSSQLIYLFNVGGRERERENTSIGWLVQSRQSCVRLTQKLASSISNREMIHGRFGMDAVSLPLYRIDVCVRSLRVPMFSWHLIWIGKLIKRRTRRRSPWPEHGLCSALLVSGKERTARPSLGLVHPKKMIHGAPKLHFVHGSSLASVPYTYFRARPDLILRLNAPFAYGIRIASPFLCFRASMEMGQTHVIVESGLLGMYGGGGGDWISD